MKIKENKHSLLFTLNVILKMRAHVPISSSGWHQSRHAHCTIVSPLARVRVNNNGRKQEEEEEEGVAQHIVFQQLRSMRNYFA